jgi:hypothetical protein
MQARAGVLFASLLLLVGAAAAVLIAEEREPSLRRAPAESFQHLVGGLGFGPSLDLADCAFTLDPRLDAGCDQDRGPIPGGSCYCPRHAGSVLHYPSLDPPGVEDGDALSP